VAAVNKKQVRFLLAGVGNVGRRFLELMLLKRDALRIVHGLEFSLVGVADSSGVALCPEGLDPATVIGLKAGGGAVAEYPGWGRPGASALEMVHSAQADLFLEASPANLRDGQPALGWVVAAFGRGMHVVLANKAPLAVAYASLVSQAHSRGVELRFDATVAGGLPAVNLGQRDLAGATICRLEGIVNLTSNYILGRLADGGVGYEEALAEAQAAGHAETDPSLDVDGWDAAAKLVILAGSVLGFPAVLGDVAVEGIASITPEMLRKAAAGGMRIRSVALAELGAAGYRLSVRPTWLPISHPLAQLGSEQMGIVYSTDVCGTILAAIVEETPMPTAFAMLRDVLQIFRRPRVSE
jgi:homoserine dehydrogenase